RYGGEAFPITLVAAEAVRDAPGRGQGDAPSYREVLLASGSLLELPGEEDLRLQVLGRDDHARSVFIESVHDARPGGRRTHSRLVGEVGARNALAKSDMENGIRQSPPSVAGAGMSHHSLSLVDDDDPLVLVEDGEGNILGIDGCRVFL